MVSFSSSVPLPRSSLSPAGFLRFALWFVENRPSSRAGRTGSVLLLGRGAEGGDRGLLPRTGLRRGWDEEGEREDGGEDGGGFRSSRESSGDAVSILFVHANYSSSVTLLEIEGTGATLSLSRPLPVALRVPRQPFSLFPFSLLTSSSSSPLRVPPFSLSFQLDLLPRPGGFLMDPDYVASSSSSPPAPLSLSSPLRLCSVAALLLFFFPGAARDLSIASRRLYEGF